MATPTTDKEPSSTPKPKGPWMLRFAVKFFSALFALLVFWLLGFVVEDIGTAPGPNWTEFEETRLDQQLVKNRDELSRQISAIRRQIDEETAVRKVLADSSSNLRETVQRLAELQRLSLEKDGAPSQDDALAKSLQSFLDKQNRYQEISTTLAQLTVEKQILENRLSEANAALDTAREPIHEAYRDAIQSHRIRIAFFQLLFLIPVLGLAGWAVVRWRANPFLPLLVGFGVAVLTRTGFVIHQYFPARVFKYIIIIAAILAVVRLLVYFIRAVVSPRRDALVRQYREAYERFLCPVCEFPIRRGPMKFLYWNRKSIRKLFINTHTLPSASTDEAEECYTCPSCGTALYEKCPTCDHTRHSLLPVCEHCGERDG